MVKPLDIVVAGPDGSGTSTQLQWIVDNLSKNYGLRVRDLKGTEIDALWHTKENPVRDVALQYRSYQEFKNFIKIVGTAKSHSGESISIAQLHTELARYRELVQTKLEFLNWSGDRVSETPTSDPTLPSMKKVSHGTFIDVNDADVWVLEEPPHRQAGLHNRVFEQYRSSFGVEPNQTAAAMSHSLYRETEFYRFRKEILAAGKICIRSRSEESACYQIYDKYHIETGPTTYQYLSLHGHKIAFGHAPTHIIIAHGPEDWTVENITEFHDKRLVARVKDDEERNPYKQLLVNQRYSTIFSEHTDFFGPFLETLYEAGCKRHKGNVPKFLRFDMTTPKDKLQAQMLPVVDKILSDAGYKRAA